MRILFASTNLPIVANNGQAIRSLSILRALAAIGHDVTFVSFADRDRPKTLQPISDYCREIDLLEWRVPILSQHSDYLGRLACLIGGKSYSVERFRSPLMQDRIQQRLRGGGFDLIVADSLYSLVNIPQTDVPIALNCHNVEHVILDRYASIEKSFVKNLYAKIEAHLLRSAEHRGCQRVALAMVCSNHDRNILHQLSVDLPIVVVPNAVDIDGYPLHQADWGSSEIILFQGGMDWYPNRDAVEFFAKAILPLVRVECPNVRFVVAGRNPPARFVEKFRRNIGIEFTGTVPDMRPYLSAATVVVVPLRLGSGTRIKILEACAMGKPVVSTSVGAEGLELKGEDEILLEDRPDDFARAVVTLLRDPIRREAMGRSARAVIVERYSQPVLRNSLDAAIRSLPKTACRTAVRQPVGSCPN